MTAQPADDPAHSNSSQSGFVTEAIRLFGSFSRHGQAILSLAGAEAKDAIALYVRLIVMLVAALIFVVFGYIFLLLTIAFAIALIFGISWVWIALGFTVLHFLVAFICALHVKTHFRTPVFAETASELSKDFALLGSKDATISPARS